MKLGRRERAETQEALGGCGRRGGSGARSGQGKGWCKSALTLWWLRMLLEVVDLAEFHAAPVHEGRTFWCLSM